MPAPPVRHSGRVDTRISQAACQDLRRIDDRAVRAELVDIALTELREPDSGSAIEGQLARRPGLWWRRGVRLADLDAFEGWDTDDDSADNSWQAFNFLLLYRRVTSDEMIHHRLHRTVDERPGLSRLQRRGEMLLVVKVWDNTVVARHLPSLA
ncbi:hypothetical protein [Flexivirga meconopsidis]|uniref:hypothetical protein n=1 Tax=Flexivirga meconopsidis TaxID=2977121 RepID=UPI00223EA697|nr:hypothetical protein [Flexivirga meconopsidis]